jgi:hypothetical protein
MILYRQERIHRALRAPLRASLLVAGHAGGGQVLPPVAGMQETFQSAAITIEADDVTVDMYVAFDGIPVGKTVTYMLPCRHEPESLLLSSNSRGEYLNSTVSRRDSRLRRLFY